MRKYIVVTMIFLAASAVVIFRSSIYGSASAQDCDSNAVIRCGITASSQLNPAYQKTGVSTIYSHFGISSQDINSFGTEAINGTVTKSGNVLVGGKVVATGAMTAGRQYMPGSRAVTSSGMTYYVRPPSVSFASSSLPAFVVMRNGQFTYAVISSCGNPVTATPVKPAVVKRIIQKPVTTTVIVERQVVPAPTQSQTVNVLPASTVTATPAAASIPNTGPGDIMKIAGVATVLGTFGHLLFYRRKII